MDKKTLFLTLGAAVVVGGIGVSLYDSQQGSAQLSSARVLPELAVNAPSLDRIKLEGAGGRLLVESHKEGEQWVIDNLGNYVADTRPLSSLINNLKDARKVEAKTAKPGHFHHLGLRDISDEQSKALLVTLSGGGKEYKLLLGDNAKNGTGQYVRLAGDNQTWLIDKSINKPDKAEDWVNDKLFDFELKDIESVSLSGKFEYVLSKKDKEQANFALDTVPDTHKLKYDSIVDSVPRAVTNLRFESLKPVADVKDGEDAQQLKLKLFDKPAEIVINVAKSGDKYYARLSGDNPQWAQWAYQLSEYNFNQLVKDKMDFLDEIKTEEKEEDKSEGEASVTP